MGSLILMVNQTPINSHTNSLIKANTTSNHTTSRLLLKLTVDNLTEANLTINLTLQSKMPISSLNPQL